jgi:hypothetical protein
MRWFGYVKRMDEHRIPKTSEMNTRRRPRDKPHT